MKESDQCKILFTQWGTTILHIKTGTQRQNTDDDDVDDDDDDEDEHDKDNNSLRFDLLKHKELNVRQKLSENCHIDK